MLMLNMNEHNTHPIMFQVHFPKLKKYVDRKKMVVNIPFDTLIEQRTLCLVRGKPYAIMTGKDVFFNNYKKVRGAIIAASIGSTIQYIDESNIWPKIRQIKTPAESSKSSLRFLFSSSLAVVVLVLFIIVKYTLGITYEKALQNYEAALDVSNLNLKKINKKPKGLKKRWWSCTHYYTGDETIINTKNNTFTIPFNKVIPVGHQNVVDGVEAFGFAKQIGVFRLYKNEVYMICCGGNINTSPFQTKVDYRERNLFARIFELVVTRIVRFDLLHWQTFPMYAIQTKYKPIKNVKTMMQYKAWFKPVSVAKGLLRRWKYFDFMYYNGVYIDAAKTLDVMPDNILTKSVLAHAWIEYPMYFSEYFLSRLFDRGFQPVPP